MLKPQAGPNMSRSEPLPHREFMHENRLKAVLAGVQSKDIRSHAVEAANQRLAGELEGKGFKGFLKKIWHGNMAREYYLAKYTKENQQNIVEAGNVFENEDLNADEYATATTLRFAHEYDGLVHEAAGEHRHANIDQNEDGSVNAEGYELKQHIFGLIKDYSAGNYDGPTPEDTDRNFDEAKNRMLTELYERGILSEEYVGEALVKVDNFLQIAQNVRAMVDHGQAMNEVLGKTDIVLGEAKVGARTEIALSRTEKIVEKLSGKAWINESTVVPAVAVAISVGSYATKLGASASLAAAVGVAVPGALAGAWAGIKESARYKQERTQLKRDIETGKIEASENSIMRSAESLIDGIGVLYDDNGELRISDEQDLREAMTIVAECETRIRLTDTGNALISDASEMDRYNLDISLSKAKVDLRKFITNADDSELEDLGFSSRDIDIIRHADDELEVVLKNFNNAAEGMLLKEITAANRIERMAYVKRVGLAVLKGATFGIGLGVAGQEVAAMVMDNTQGLVDGYLGYNNEAGRQTLLQSVIGHKNSENVLLASHEESFYGYNKAELPEGFSMNSGKNGTMVIVGPNGFKIDDITLTSDGRFTAESENMLKSKGFNIDTTYGVKTVDVSREATLSAREFINNHSGDITKVKRDFWYKGADLGMGDVRVDANGDYVISISGMNSHAYSPSGQEINWHEAARDGKLAVALTTSSGAQSEVFMVNVDPNGDVVINKDSFEASLFSNERGTPIIKADMAEIVEVSEVDADGITHVRPLATELGEGSATFSDSVSSVVNIPTVTYEMNYSYEAPVSGAGAPIVMPIYSRRGMPVSGGRKELGAPILDVNEPEPVRPVRAESSPEASPEATEFASVVAPELPPDKFQPAEDFRQQWEFERSPTLEENPDADLNISRELDRYIADQVVRRGRNYINSIEQLETSAGLDKLIDAETKAVVCTKIEAGTTGTPVYDTLSLYAKQSAEAQAKSVILLDVAWSDEIDSDPLLSGRSDEINAELERARADFPNLKVAAYSRDWSHKGSVTENMAAKERYDVVALAVESAASQGQRASDDDILIVANDNQIEGISADYLDSYIRESENHPDTDVFTGSIRRDVAAANKYPGYGIVMSFLSNLETEHQQENPGMHGYVVQNGTNTAFRLSAYVAVGGCGSDEVVRAESDVCQRIFDARQGAALYKSEVSRHVGGAQINATTNESLDLYRRNHWIAESISPDIESEPPIGPENAQDNFDDIIERIELNVNSYASNIPNTPEVMQNALIKTFGPISGSRASFTLKWSRDYTKVRFELTNVGKQTLKEQLTGGGAETYGQKLQRELYESGRMIRSGSIPEESEAVQQPEIAQTAETSQSQPRIFPEVGDVVFATASGLRLSLDGITSDGIYRFTPVSSNMEPARGINDIVLEENRLSRMMFNGELTVVSGSNV